MHELPPIVQDMLSVGFGALLFCSTLFGLRRGSVRAAPERRMPEWLMILAAGLVGGGALVLGLIIRLDLLFDLVAILIESVVVTVVFVVALIVARRQWPDP